MHNILSKNPLGSGGVGRMFTVRPRGTGLRSVQRNNSNIRLIQNKDINDYTCGNNNIPCSKCPYVCPTDVCKNYDRDTCQQNALDDNPLCWPWDASQNKCISKCSGICPTPYNCSEAKTIGICENIRTTDNYYIKLCKWDYETTTCKPICGEDYKPSIPCYADTTANACLVHCV